MTLWGPITWWGLAAAIPAVFAEYLARKLPGEWHDYWWIFTPIAVVISYAIFHLVRQPGVNLIDAFIVFAFSTMLSRVFVSIVLLDDVVKGGTWVALCLLLLARAVQTFWGK